MDYSTLLTVFTTVFLAEIGDKTQLATICYSAKCEEGKFLIFLGSSLALVLSSALGVWMGGFINQFLNPKYLTWAAGAGFILVGIWTIIRA